MARENQGSPVEPELLEHVVERVDVILWVGAASHAEVASAGDPAAISVMASPVAGSSTVIRSPSDLSRHSPLINSRAL